MMNRCYIKMGRFNVCTYAELISMKRFDDATAITIHQTQRTKQRLLDKRSSSIFDQNTFFILNVRTWFTNLRNKGSFSTKNFFTLYDDNEISTNLHS